MPPPLAVAVEVRALPLGDVLWLCRRRRRCGAHAGSGANGDRSAASDRSQQPAAAASDEWVCPYIVERKTANDLRSVPARAATVCGRRVRSPFAAAAAAAGCRLPWLLWLLCRDSRCCRVQAAAEFPEPRADDPHSLLISLTCWAAHPDETADSSRAPMVPTRRHRLLTPMKRLKRRLLAWCLVARARQRLDCGRTIQGAEAAAR